VCGVTCRVNITRSRLVRNQIDMSGGLYEKHAVVTWNLGTISGFACTERKTKKFSVYMTCRRVLFLCARGTDQSGKIAVGPRQHIPDSESRCTYDRILFSYDSGRRAAAMGYQMFTQGEIDQPFFAYIFLFATLELI
jgi:hypothetical protein